MMTIIDGGCRKKRVSLKGLRDIHPLEPNGIEE
jgi:hypothetical protein